MAKTGVGRSRRLLHPAAVLVATALLLAWVAPATAQDGAMYGARPAPDGSGDRSSAAFVLSIGQGSSVADAVEILNFTDTSTVFDLYAVDALTTTDGGLAPAARDAEVTGSARWVSVAQASVEVAARSAKTVRFTVDVPDGTALGDQTAALVIEPLMATDQGNVAARTRIGLWLRVTVTQGHDEVPGGWSMPWGWPWIVVIPVLLAVSVWVEYATRSRRREWLRDRREEHAVVEELRRRRRLDSAAKRHH